MVIGKTLLYIKEIEKGKLVSNFRAIPCLPLIYKLLTGILAQELYGHLKKTQIYQHLIKKDEEKVADTKRINYY